MPAVLGHIAGEGVVRRVREASSALPVVDAATIDAIRVQSAVHLSRPDGMPWKRFEDEMRQTVTDYAGVRRTDRGLRLAIETLRSLATREPQLKADDLHGLMRVHEAKNVRMNAEIMATASLARTETRTGSAHWRLDHPKPDEKNWRKFVVVECGADGPATKTLSTDQPLSAAFGRNRAAALIQ